MPMIINKWRKKTINQIKCNGNNGTSSSSSYPTAARHAIELRVCNVHIDFSILLARTAGERERETAKQSKCMCACRVCICLFLFVSFTHFYLHFIRRFAACRMHEKTQRLFDSICFGWTFVLNDAQPKMWKKHIHWALHASVASTKTSWSSTRNRSFMLST